MNLRSMTFWTLFLFVVSIPSDNVIRISSIGSLTRLIGMLAILLGVLALFRGRFITFRMPSLFLLFATLYTLYAGMTYFWSENVSATIISVITFAQLIVMAWLVWEFAREASRRLILMQGFVLGSIISLVAAANTIFSTEDYVFRELGKGFDANEFATVLAFGIPMAWRLALTWQNRFLIWFNTLYLPLAIFGVVMAASRGGLIVTLISLMIIPLTFPRLSINRKIILFLLISVATWGIFVYFPQIFPDWQRNLERLAGTSSEIQDGTWTGRLLIYEAGIELFWQHPYLGIGSGAFASTVEPIFGRAIVAHNTFLSVLTEGGIMGFLLFIAMIISIIPSLLNRSTGSRAFSIILFTILIVGIIPLTAEKSKYVWFVLALLAGEASPIISRVEQLLPFKQVKALVQ